MENKNQLKLKKRSAILLDTDYIIKNERTVVRLLLKAKKTFYLYDRYLPYFYVDAPWSEAQKILSIKKIQNGREIKPIKIEPIKQKIKGREKEVLKLYFRYPSDVPIFRELLKDYEKYEYDILFGRRYIIDKGIGPFQKIIYLRRGKRIKKILGSQENQNVRLKILALDIETYNPQGMPRPSKDPIIMISYYFLDEEKNIERGEVLTYKSSNLDYVKKFENEKEMIEYFKNLIKELDPEVLVGFNSSNFDIPYILERANIHKIKLDIAKDESEIRIDKTRQYQRIIINGRVHIDLYPVLRFFSFIGTYKLNRYTLETAYQTIVGESSWKTEIDRLEIYKIWDEEKDLDKLFEYSLFDAKATLEITKKILPLQIELSRITYLPLSDTIYATSSQLIESLILHHAKKRNEIITNKPDEQTARERALNPIEGAFVKTPNPGIYENIVVFDFRGLYPSIIISHNIDPFSIITKEEEDKYSEDQYYLSPIGVKFKKEPKGIIPYILEKILSMRSELKDKLKKLDPESQEYKIIWARQQSLKILANSYYGYLAFSRSRYYSRPCAQSITAWGRYFINKTIEDAEKNGFEVLYADTDSVFLLLGKKTKEEAIEWMEKYNSSLPGTMELELEAYYPRGVFVSKKIEKKDSVEVGGAKKKYALIDENGRIKIRGFELVRRDWAVIAKETQKKVLEAILKEGSKQKAIEIVKETIEKIKNQEIPIEKMVIETQLTKNLEDYEAKSPELVAALKYNRRTKGEKLSRGSIIRFVITKDSYATDDLFKNCKKLKQAQSKKSSAANISLKAESIEYAKNYDVDYYINHQIIPAVLRILKELGVNSDDLKMGGNQTGLASF
ncbi:MAG: DNA-directed DNA polymerase [Candidatus Anstonellaceae archaeon]